MKAVQYSHQGKRDNQEDAFGTEHDKFYVVCDGVGGHEKGEVASNFVVDFVKNNFSKIEFANKASFQQLILNAQDAINEQLDASPEAAGMGTTFAGIFRSEEAYYVVHLGDSRIYWVKPETEQIWHTWDHSMVGNLMQMGEISREEGRFHPNGNRISKAIIANVEGKTSKPDISKLTQVDSGDLFLICSDGVTEAWSEYELLDLLCKTDVSTEQKLAKIKERCANESKDNNTAILLEVDSSSALNGAPNEEISWISLDYFRADFEGYNLSQEIEIDIPADIRPEEPIELELVHESDYALPPLPDLSDSENDTKKKVFMVIVLIIIALIAVIFVKKMTDGAEKSGDGLLILAKENQLYGFQNSSKEWMIPARYLSAEPFEDGRAKVSTKDSVYYINEKGEMIVFVNLVSNVEAISQNQGATDISNKPNISNSPNPDASANVSSQAHAPASNDVGNLLNNNLGSSGSSAYFDNDALVEKAFQKLITNYATSKIPTAQEKKFLDRIENNELRESYRKKIAKHNSTFSQPSAPNIPLPSSPNPEPTTPSSIPDIENYNP